jgi:xanthine/uracil permease
VAIACVVVACATGLDREKTICIGLAVLGGIAVDSAPGIAIAAPKALLPILSSSLVAGTTIAIIVNAVFAGRRMLTAAARLVAAGGRSLVPAVAGQAVVPPLSPPPR